MGRVDRPGTAWSGPVAVRFTPPEGVSPGLLGTVIDGRADAIDGARTFAQVARAAQRDTLAAEVFDLGWIDPVLAVGDFARLGTEALEAMPDLSSLADIGDLDLFGELGDVLGSVTDGAGDIASRMSDLLDVDIRGCDGCDLGW